MVGVDEAPQEADGDRLDAVVEQLLDGLARLLLVELEEHVAGPVDALRDLLDEAGGTIGSGLRWRDTCSSRSIGSPAERPNERIMISASRWPRVVMRPVVAPRICTSTLVPTVVPCSSRSVWVRSSSRPRPARRAASSTAAMKPAEKSGGVDEALASVTVPDSSMITQSVNVPPMSTPQ